MAKYLNHDERLGNQETFDDEDFLNLMREWEKTGEEKYSLTGLSDAEIIRKVNEFDVEVIDY